MIVVDASAVVASLVERGHLGDVVRSRMISSDLAVPALVDLEVASALRGMLAGGRLSAVEAETALAAWAAQDVERVVHQALLARVWELRANLTPYDAVYVALAEFLGASLLTLDRGLAEAPGVRCAVELIT